MKQGLFVGLGKPGVVPLSSDEPVIVGNASTMLVDIGSIDFFDKNPRTSRNEKYDEIKESIRERGLDNPLPISRRPGENNYFIYKGGNTRLQALKELWEETANERFAKVYCVYSAYDSELDALAAHIRENVLRDNMTLVDKANSILNWKAMLEEEIGESLSQRKLVELLKTRGGIPTSQGDISKFEYVAYLNTLIPTVLKSGLGKHQIERITQLEKAGLAVWRHYADRFGSNDDFRGNVFSKAVAGTDILGKDWNYDAAEEAVVMRLLVSSGMSASVTKELLREGLRRALDGKAVPVTVPATKNVDVNADPVVPVVAPNPVAEDKAVERTPAIPVSSGYGREEPEDKEPLYTGAASDAAGAEIHVNDVNGTNNVVSPYITPDDWGMDVLPDFNEKREIILKDGNWIVRLEQLREQNYKTAIELGGYVKNGNRSIVKIQHGYGFLIVDVWDTSWIESKMEEIYNKEADAIKAQMTLTRANHLWWFLVQHSDSFIPLSGFSNFDTACPEEIRYKYTGGMSLDINSINIETFNVICPAPNAQSMLLFFWYYISPSVLDKAISIIKNNRDIRDLLVQHADGASIWEVQS